jgi:hypothetical protein
MNKDRRVFEITVVHIWIVVLIAVIALTITFELGVLLGKKKMINDELEAIRRGDIQIQDPYNVQNTDPDVKNRSLLSRKSKSGQNILNEGSSRDLNGWVGSSDLEESDFYTIQVGVFSSQYNAKNLTNMLTSEGYEAWIDIKSDTEIPSYGVMIGRFKEADEARRLGDSILEKMSDLTDYKIKEFRE